MRYYYTNANNQPVGPSDLAQLKALEVEGKINDASPVIPEGGQVWTTYGAIKDASVNPAKPTTPTSEADKIATILGDQVAGFLRRLSGWLSPEFLKVSLASAGRYGHFAVLAGAALGLVLALVTSIRAHSLGDFFLYGIGFVLAVAVGQFAAQRFMFAGESLIAGTPNRISSKSFLECLGLFATLGAVGALITGVVASIRVDSLVPLIPAILLAIYLIYFTITALHPEQVNLQIDPGASAGEEAISLLSFSSKVMLKLVPLFFCVLAVLGAVATMLSMFESGQMISQSMLGFLPIPYWASSYAGASVGTAAVLLACLLPLLAYLFFIFTYLTLDLLRAILSIPGKLDALRKS